MRRRLATDEIALIADTAVFSQTPADDDFSLRAAIRTVLVQVLPNRKLKFEAFPGWQGREVEGFTENAKTYERQAGDP